MAEMEFGRTFAMKSGETMTTALVEGGGVALGFLGAGALGKLVEKNLKPDVTKDSLTMDKIVAWVADNAPKAGLWYLAYKFGPAVGTAPRGMGELMLVDAKKAVVASIVVDSVMRLANNGAPGAGFSLFGIQMMPGEAISGTNPQLQKNLQQVVRENGSLRAQLNQALGKLASLPPSSPSPKIVVTPYAEPHPDHDRKYGMMQTTPEAEDRRKNYGAMTPPIEEERNRKYGAMDKARLNFAGESESLASAFGML